jgi:hypothetical protein
MPPDRSRQPAESEDTAAGGECAGNDHRDLETVLRQSRSGVGAGDGRQHRDGDQ